MFLNRLESNFILGRSPQNFYHWVNMNRCHYATINKNLWKPNQISCDLDLLSTRNTRNLKCGDRTGGFTNKHLESRNHSSSKFPCMHEPCKNWLCKCPYTKWIQKSRFGPGSLLFHKNSLRAFFGSKGGGVLRALPSHWCSNPGIDAIFWLSLSLDFSFVTSVVIIYTGAREDNARVQSHATSIFFCS